MSVDEEINLIESHNSSSQLLSVSVDEQMEPSHSLTQETHVEEFEMKLADMEKKLADGNRKLEKANAILRTTAKQKSMWRQTYAKQRRDIVKLKKQLSQLTSSTKQIFSDDQMLALTKKSSRGVQWSNDTIKKALRLKFACGSTGYTELLAQKIPLPSERTLRRKLEGMDFEEGICNEAFEQLREAVEHFEDDRSMDAVLGLDEMAIRPSRELDPSSKRYCGVSSFRTSKGTQFPHLFFLTHKQFAIHC